MKARNRDDRTGQEKAARFSPSRIFADGDVFIVFASQGHLLGKATEGEVD
jgi:hypothetical protein